MIYFFAGAPKHGSHFQLYIISEALNQKGINYKPVGGKIFDRNNSLAAKELLYDLERKKSEYFICKGHFLNKKLLLSYDMKIFLIWRQLGDVMVSRYHYLQRRYRLSFNDFADFYSKEGRRHVFYQRAYYLLWRHENDPRVFHVSYSALRENFQKNITSMLKFAGLDDIDLSELEETVSIEKSRKKHNDPDGILIRKGAVDEYKSVIPNEIIEDMSLISNMSLSKLKIHALLNDPKVFLSSYFHFPGKKYVSWFFQKRRDKQGKQNQDPKESDIMWWS